MHEFIRLFLVFAKVGVMTVGGGYAMLPMLMRELIEKRGWLDDEEFADMTAIGQCTPGIIAVNMATYVGCKRAGTAGGIVATLGVIFPSVIIISVIAAVLRQYTEIAAVKHAFAGIRVAVCALIVKTVVSMCRAGARSRDYVVFLFLAFLCSVAFGVSPVLVVLGTAALAILAGLLRARKGGGEK